MNETLHNLIVAGFKANKVYELFTQVASSLNDPRQSSETYLNSCTTYNNAIAKLWDEWDIDENITEEELNTLLCRIENIIL